MSSENRINIYIPDREQFDAQIKEAAAVLTAMGYQLAQHDVREPSASKVLLAALAEIVKKSKKQS